MGKKTRRRPTKGREIRAHAAPQEPPAREEAGDRRHRPTAQTRALVASMAGLGHPQTAIAKMIGLGSKMTLAKHYRTELDQGMITANNEVLSEFFKTAKDSKHRAYAPVAIFWLKNRLGWHDRQGIELSGKDGAPLPSASPLQVVNDNVVFLLPDNGRDLHLDKRRMAEKPDGKEKPRAAPRGDA